MLYQKEQTATVIIRPGEQDPSTNVAEIVVERSPTNLGRLLLRPKKTQTYSLRGPDVLHDDAYWIDGEGVIVEDEAQRDLLGSLTVEAILSGLTNGELSLADGFGDLLVFPEEDTDDPR